MFPLNFAINITNGSFSIPKFLTVEEATLPKCLDTMSRNLNNSNSRLLLCIYYNASNLCLFDE